MQIIGKNFGWNLATAGYPRAQIYVDGVLDALLLGVPYTPTQTSIWFKAPINTGRGHTVQVSLVGQRSNTLLLNYSAPSGLSFSPASGNTQGGTTLVVSGTNLGVNGSASVTVNGVACTSVTARTDTQLQCTAPAGAGTSVPVVVTIAGQSATGTWSYGGPQITYVTGCTSNPYPTTANCPISGGTTIVIHGLNFGSTLVIGGVSLTATLALSSGNAACGSLTMTVAQTTLTCVLPPGIGVNVTLTVARGAQSGSLNAVTYAVCVFSLCCLMCCAGSYVHCQNAAFAR